MMVIGLVSVTIGLLLTWWLGSRRALFALVAAMVAGVAVALAVTVFWKISIHTVCAAGTLANLVLEFGHALSASLPLVAAIAWARVALGDHTIAQAVAGTVVGSALPPRSCRLPLKSTHERPTSPQHGPGPGRCQSCVTWLATSCACAGKCSHPAPRLHTM